MDVRMHRMTKTLACWRALLRVTRTFRKNANACVQSGRPALRCWMSYKE